MKHKRLVMALGGNAILQPGEKGTLREQYGHIQKTAGYMARLISHGYELVLTHGNGPQVGNLLLQNEALKEEIPPMPVDVLNAETQGYIGYLLMQGIENELIKIGLNRPVATLITRVLVDENDPAFKNPSKPVGPFYTEQETKKLQEKTPWIYKEDAGRGYRRVIASPMPQKIVEIDIIREFLEKGISLISTGGGGIPVIKDHEGCYFGIEAVIDKDRSGALLAKELLADAFYILTDVSHVQIHYKTAKAMALEEIEVAALKIHLKNGAFSAGSMAPKVESAIRFVEETGKRAYICSLDNIVEVVNGKGGTVILP